MLDRPSDESAAPLPGVQSDFSPTRRVDCRSRGAAGSGLGRYRVRHEIGRGGMGVVLRAHDSDLDRDLAVKVLLEHYLCPEMERRFLEEARVNGRLQHPGIVPVHEVGHDDAGRPYFTMKLVEGRTLAALLDERPSPSHDLPRFLGVFAQIAQTVAYAHSKGVLHRDLKPSNVMVGAFGEVQVMDWGLAKQTGNGGAEAEVAGASPALPHAAADTRPGDVLGTPAYMAPEQARGEFDRVDERADVFGLGAILCEVLTGVPPFPGESSTASQVLAACGALGDAFARLNACGAEAELVDLAKACLAAEAAGRPRDAGVVAERVAAYQAAVQQRLHAAELGRAAADAKVEEARAREQEAQRRAAAERRARRLTVGLAAAVLLLLTVGGGAGLWLWQSHQAAGRERRSNVGASLARADELFLQKKWVEARTALEQAAHRLGDAPDDDLRERIRTRGAELNRVERDEEMTRRLDQARQQRAATNGTDFDYGGADQLYQKAFAFYQLPVAEMSPEEAARHIRDSDIREPLVQALDDWSIAKINLKQPGDWKALLTLADLADDNPGRREVRAALVKGDAKALRRLAEAKPSAVRQSSEVIFLARALKQIGMRPYRLELLRREQQRRPGDFWLALELGVTSAADGPEQAGPVQTAIFLNGRGTVVPAHKTEALRFLTVAVNLRPDSHVARNHLGAVLLAEGQAAEAEAEFREAVRLSPESFMAHQNLGNALLAQGKVTEAEAECREALRLNPRFASGHGNLALILQRQGKPAEAMTEHKEAVRLDPKDPCIRNNYGNALQSQRKLAEAAVELREAIALRPDYAAAHYNLAVVLHLQGRMPEALGGFRAAARLRPDDAEYREKLGLALLAQGKGPEAFAEFREAIRLQPGYAPGHYGLGTAFLRQDRWAEAEVELREAIRLDPKIAEAHTNLGVALAGRKQWDQAIACYDQALRLNPDLTEAHFNLGKAREARGEMKAAEAAYRQAVRLKPDGADFHYKLGVALREQQQFAEALTEFREALRLNPGDSDAQFQIGLTLAGQGKPDEAAAAYREAIRLRPAHAGAHHNLGTILQDQGQLAEAEAEVREARRHDPDAPPIRLTLGAILFARGKRTEAEAEFRQLIRLKPDYAEAHYNLGYLLLQEGKPAEAVAALEEAIRRKPDLPEAYINLGTALKQQGRFADALAAYRRCHELGQKRPGWPFPSAQWVRQAEKMVELDARLTAVLRKDGKPADAAEAAALAPVCVCKRYHATAARFFALVFAAAPYLADDVRAGHRFQAAGQAVLAAAGQGEDPAPPDEKQRADLRRQALNWLRADLEQWRRGCLDGNPADRILAQETLLRWREDRALAGVRDREALGGLSEDDRRQWRQLWDDVDGLLDRLRERR